jgi:hypothetical protein
VQQSANSLVGLSMQATDGDIGLTKEFYFDDLSWKIRFIVVKTSPWLSGRIVLISPEPLVSGSWSAKSFPVHLTKKQIQESPVIDTDKPVSRQQEIDIYGHYPWQGYWENGFYAGGQWRKSGNPAIIDRSNPKGAGLPHDRSDDDLHLRGTHEIIGYRVHALDGEIGLVEDFILDDQTWELIYLVVYTHHWLGERKALLEVGHIKKVQWENSELILDIAVASLQNCKPSNKAK